MKPDASVYAHVFPPALTEDDAKTISLDCESVPVDTLGDVEFVFDEAVLSRDDDVAIPLTWAAYAAKPNPPVVDALSVAVIVAPDETADAFSLYQISSVKFPLALF